MTPTPPRIEHRDLVLERLRKARAQREASARLEQGRPASIAPAIAAPTVATAAAGCSSAPTAQRDDSRSRIERFASALEQAQGVCHRVTSDAGASDALLAILRDRTASNVVRSDDQLVIDILEGVTGGFRLVGPDAPRATLLAAELGVTRASFGIVEYGTIVLASGDQNGRARQATERNRFAALLPEAHAAIVSASDLVETWDDALTKSRGSDGLPPPTLTFATGPSRTADIELELVLGVHGPRSQHVILLEHR